MGGSPAPTGRRVLLSRGLPRPGPLDRPGPAWHRARRPRRRLRPAPGAPAATAARAPRRERRRPTRPGTRPAVRRGTRPARRSRAWRAAAGPRRGRARPRPPGAAPIDSRAGSRTGRGHRVPGRTRRGRARATTLPSTATPSVPPSSRVASLTAEPMPAFAAGTTPMIASVAGALVRPRPEPMQHHLQRDRRGTPCPRRRSRSRRTRRPAAAGRRRRRALVPKRTARRDAERSTRRAMQSANGQDAAGRPRAARSPSTNWKYWVIRKMKPNSAKNENVTDAAGGGEAQVGEQPHVEHRVLDAALPERRRRRAERAPRREAAEAWPRDAPAARRAPR